MMKRIIALTLIALMLLSVCACGTEEQTTISTTEATTETTTYPATEETSVANTETTVSTTEIQQTTLIEEVTTLVESEVITEVEEISSVVPTETEAGEIPSEEAETTSEANEIVETTEEETFITVINDTESLNELLDGAMIFKIGEKYALINGKKEAMNATPIIEVNDVGISVLFPADFIFENGLCEEDESRVTERDGIRYVNGGAIISDSGAFFIADNYIVITDVFWCFGDNQDSLYPIFEKKVNNLYSIGTSFSAQMNGERPVVFVTDENLAQSKMMADLMVEPFYTSWLQLRAMAELALTVEIKPYTGSSAQEYRFAACNEFIAARALALAYRHTGEEKYLNRAVEYLMAYADGEQRPGTQGFAYDHDKSDGRPDIGLNIALPLTTACDTYAIIYPFMTDSDRALVESWIQDSVKLVKQGHQFWLSKSYYGNQVGNNHLTSHLMGLISAAYALQDDKLLEYAVNSSKNESGILTMLERAILMEGDELYASDPTNEDTSKPFAVGEIYDRYRVVQNNGFGYAMYHLKFLTYSALAMSNNGLDLFSYVGANGENLLLPFKAYSEYLIKNDVSLGSGYYAGNPLDRETPYTLYLIANRFYEDEDIKNVLKAFAESKLVAADKEQMGRSGGYLFGNVE